MSVMDKNSQLVCLLLVGIFNMICSILLLLFFSLFLSGMPVN